MRRLTLLSITPVAAFAAGLGAQNPPATPPTNPPQQQPAAGAPAQGGAAQARRPRPYAQVIPGRARTMRGGVTIHQVDEHTSIDDLEKLTEIYGRFISSFFRTG